MGVEWMYLSDWKSERKTEYILIGQTRNEPEIRVVGGDRASDCISRRFEICPERRVEYLHYALCAMRYSHDLRLTSYGNIFTPCSMLYAIFVGLWLQERTPEQLKGEGG